MRNAYALLGLSFFIVFVGAYFVLERANAPTPDDIEISEVTDEEPKVIQEEPIETEEIMLTLTSPAFSEGEKIPAKYTCDGEDVNPELHISGAPEGTESFVLVMDDPDAPNGTWAHWALYGIPGDTTVIGEGVAVGSGAINSWGRDTYGGPCPPSGVHRYIFRLYALSGQLNFIKQPTLAELEGAAKGSAIESATLIGTYSRN